VPDERRRRHGQATAASSSRSIRRNPPHRSRRLRRAPARRPLEPDAEFVDRSGSDEAEVFEEAHDLDEGISVGLHLRRIERHEHVVPHGLDVQTAASRVEADACDVAVTVEQLELHVRRTGRRPRDQRFANMNASPAHTPPTTTPTTRMNPASVLYV